jgi:hypothetical protein
LDILKEKMVTVSILVFPYWEEEFHVHVNESAIALGEILTHLGDDDIYHPIEFTNKKLSDS